jgi:hypothetical protein
MTNHPAFPIAPYEGDNTNPPLRANSGISALDYFASDIAAALIAKTKGEIEPEELAQTAFAYSRAMLEERTYHLNKK